MSVNPTTGSPNGVLTEQQARPADYVVQRGDTLWDISQRTGIPLDVLIAENPHIDNPHWIYPGDPIFYPEGAGPDQPGGADETSGTDQPGDTGGTDQPGSNSPEAQAVGDAITARDRAQSNLNDFPGTLAEAQEAGLVQALTDADQAVQTAIEEEIAADVAALEPPPATYEEYQQAVADSAARITARYADDPVTQRNVQAAANEVTSVEYLEQQQAQAQDSVDNLPSGLPDEDKQPVRDEAARIGDILEGARAVHESPQALATQQAVTDLTTAQANLETQQAEGTPNEITAAQRQVAEAEQALDQAIAAEINARVAAAGATDPEEVEAITAQTQQDILSRTDPGARTDVQNRFAGASTLAANQRTTDASGGSYDSAADRIDQYNESGDLDTGYTSARDRYDSTKAELKTAVEAELEFGINAYTTLNPDATPEQIAAEAERLGDAIVARNGNSEHVREIVETVVNDYD